MIYTKARKFVKQMMKNPRKQKRGKFRQENVRRLNNPKPFHGTLKQLRRKKSPGLRNIKNRNGHELTTG